MIALSDYLIVGAILFRSACRHLPEPQERDPAADVHRTDAARGQHQLHRVLAFLGDTAARSSFLHPDRRGGRRGGDRSWRSWSCCSATGARSTSPTWIP